MSNWRELGVIPDSEDEGDYFVDDELPLSHTQTPVITSVSKAQYAESIWDVPESDDDGQADTPIPEAPPLSPRPSLRERPEPETTTIPFTLAEDISQNQVQPFPLNNPETSSPFLVPTFNEVASHSSQNAEDISSSGVADATSSGNNDLASTLSTSHQRPAIPGGDGIHHYATDWEGTVAAAGHRRSLRPRTLIQEHPYAIDLARHSNDFRQHGLIPVKMVVGTEKGLLPRASQDGDFNLDSQNDDLPPASNNTEASSFTASMRERHTPDVNPPWSNAPQHDGRAASNSSASSPTNVVDDDAFDQDLPDLSQLLKRNLQTGKTNKRMRQASQIQPLAQRIKRRGIIYSDSPEPNSAVGRISRSPSPSVEWPDSNAQQTVPVSSQELGSQNRYGQQRKRETSETTSEAEGDVHQAVTEFRRRIRGVLPASWLRLDQQTSKKSSHHVVKKNLQHRFPNQQQRGIAITKKVAPDSTALNDVPMELGEESPVRYTADDLSEHQSRISFSHSPEQENDGADEHSALEEDRIAPMVIGSKRQLQLPRNLKRNRKRAKVSSGPRTQFARSRPRQQAITGFFHSEKDELTGSMTVDHFSDDSLSILDTIEPDAPRFIRIAARSAKQTMNLGRSSVQRKTIRLATRQDQIDAMSVMEKWKSGLIAQRPSVSAASKSNRRRRQRTNIDQHLSKGKSASRNTFGIFRGISRKFIKYHGDSGTIGYRRNQSHNSTNKTSISTLSDNTHLPSPASREAQLEVDERTGEAIVSFRSRKRALDRIFNKQTPKKFAWHLAETNNTLAPRYGAAESNITEYTPPRIFQEQEQKARQIRPRKRTRPRRIDVTAPQYTHAADPLPVDAPILINDVPSEKSKLYGLGPYGTRYTHHFEIFPLIPEVQLHKSTVLGNGTLKAFLIEDSRIRLSDLHRQISVRLNDQIFIWSSWNPKVSSELGILFDLIAELLEDGQERGLRDGRHVIDAVHSTLEYIGGILDPVALESQIPPLIPRLQEVFRGFIDRVSIGLGQASFNHAANRQLLLKILDRVFLMSSMMVKHCQTTAQLMDELPAAERTMLLLAKLMISVLLRCGTNQIKQIYKEFSQLHCSGRMLGESAVEMHSWITLIKSFEHVGSRQVSFWNVLETAVLKPEVLSSTDAREFENVWEIIFTLLPLFEFDDTGKVVAEKQHKTGNEGWSMPQKLIRRVFQLYQENDQQAASFNSYCRALISRCHYLVQQWGWLRSTSVIGVIFDFFGSRRLAHLRNEEVYRSPQFLETLADRPVLEVEEDDYCFHIFLKLLAISIKKLEKFGSEKDIRNLITRTIPNHSRLYLKEHNIHERDLAALRNHHDLIATLFWAAPPDTRPSVALIEGLITPASSHKEACLINIRSWAQLSRFVVSSGETKASFSPFNQWRNTFFQQMLVQFGGIENDINQQYLTLSKDKSTFITQNAVETAISKNKAAVMDVLHLSLTASLDVLKYAPDLEAATYCLNTLHLKQLFKYFTAPSSELDWSILRVALTILDVFLSAVEKFKESQQSLQKQDISCTYFSMAKCVLSLPTETLSLTRAATADMTWCIRQIIVLSARMGIGFINGGFLTISDLFKPGKWCLFPDQLHTMDPPHRQHCMMFISSLLEHRFDDFSGVDFNIFEVWALALVTPLKYLKCEGLFGIQHYCHAEGFAPPKMAESRAQPSYKSNLLLFEFAVTSMRKNIRRADSRLRRASDLEYSKTLKHVMKQMRNDLSLVYGDTSQHQRFVTFVQHIVSSIKAHGSDICTIDNFFLQVSAVYSPPIQDVQLQIAGMLSYGIRIEEGDSRATHELFFLMFNNFKHALVNGNLTRDVRMLRRGMKHQSILAFVLGKMLPAILRVSFMDSSSFALLDVYAEALHLLLSGRILSRQLDNNDLPHVVVTMRAIVEGMRVMRRGQRVLKIDAFLN
ncbi:mus7/MMS22 family domain-containing protein [Trichoderma breve]|uniref:Mus7/MMS22 family domain-containing protein n=1 Tax=Trichoderma breve TaxID=2034170 RepID=A0A9W9BBZ1_9HYPO|nr:mus7/MMS22 family domain-containing protein [Trichoderma breve]KAJ4858549.1 mus7/MMS22 family domain-containing protein [Trichoderma breve]